MGNFFKGKIAVRTIDTNDIRSMMRKANKAAK